MKTSPEIKLEFDERNVVETQPAQKFETDDLPKMKDSPFFLRLTTPKDNQFYYPTAGDLVLQLLLPKYDPFSNDLTPMGSWPVVVIFSDRGACISLPIWDSPRPPQHVPYIELDRDLEYVGTPQLNIPIPTRAPGNHLYALLTPVYACAKTGIQWLFPKYKDLPLGSWLWPTEPFCQFSISPAKLRWYEWRVYYALFPNLLPAQYPPFGSVSDEYHRGKFRCREYENISKFMEMVSDLLWLWDNMAENEYISWTEEDGNVLGENAGKRIDPPIIRWDGRLLDRVPEWRDVTLLPLPSRTPGQMAAQGDREKLQNIMRYFGDLVTLRGALVDPDLLWESEKYLLRVPPVDDMPLCSSAVSRTRCFIDENESVVLIPIDK